MERCALCLRAEELDTKSDYLRHIYMDVQGNPLHGFYQPRLTPQEKWKLKAAGGKEQIICSNRANCRKRSAIREEN